MAQWVKVLASKFNNRSSTPGSHIVEGRTDSHHMYIHTRTHMHTTHTDTERWGEENGLPPDVHTHAHACTRTDTERWGEENGIPPDVHTHAQTQRGGGEGRERVIRYNKISFSLMFQQNKRH